MASAFSSDGESVIAKSVSVNEQGTAVRPLDVDLVHFYDLEYCVDRIHATGHHEVALQFPDSLLRDAVAIVAHLTRAVKHTAHFFVLGDTSFASCCVDEVAAQHGNAQMIIHFGDACLGSTARTDVLYVFGRKHVDASSFVADVRHRIATQWLAQGDDDVGDEVDPEDEGKEDAAGGEDAVVVFYDVAYARCMEEQVMPLLTPEDHVYVTQVQRWQPHCAPDQASSKAATSTATVLGRFLAQVPAGPGGPAPFGLGPKTRLVFVGRRDSPVLTALLLCWPQLRCWTLDPSASAAPGLVPATGSCNAALMRRYWAIERIRDATSIGVVAATLSLHRYTDVVQRARHLVKSWSEDSKRAYVLLVGKLNPPKLLNFAHIDAFVIVACPFATWNLVSGPEAREYGKALVTPFELELALGGQHEWSGRYVLEFGTVLQMAGGDGAPNVDATHDDDGDESAAPRYSLVSGRIASHAHDRAHASGEQSVIPKAPDEVARQYRAAASYLREGATFAGLDPNVDSQPVQLATEGLDGVAAGYQHEGKESSSKE